MKAILCTYHILDYGFDTFWATEMQPYWPLLWLEDECEREKGAACSLVGDELYECVGPGIVSWEAEGIAICQFVGLLYVFEEVL